MSSVFEHAISICVWIIEGNSTFIRFRKAVERTRLVLESLSLDARARQSLLDFTEQVSRLGNASIWIKLQSKVLVY